MRKIVLPIFAMLTMLILSNCSTNSISPEKKKALEAQKKLCFTTFLGSPMLFYGDTDNAGACWSLAKYYNTQHYYKGKDIYAKNALVVLRRGCKLNHLKSCTVAATMYNEKNKFYSSQVNFITYAEKIFNLGDTRWSYELSQYYKKRKDYRKSDYYSNANKLRAKYPTYQKYILSIQSKESKRKILKKKVSRKAYKPKKKSAWMKAAISNERRRINAMYGTK